MEANKQDEKNEKDKINQPEVMESGNDDFPKEYEEQRSEKIRMKPQPLAKPNKEDDSSK